MLPKEIGAGDASPVTYSTREVHDRRSVSDVRVVNLETQRIMHKCILVYKCLNNLAPPIFVIIS